MVHDLVRGSGNISVHVIAGEEQEGEANATRSIAASAAQPFDPLPYVIAIVAVAIATGVGIITRPLLGIENVDLILLTAVVGIAVRYGLWPSLVATVAASLGYNFFFLPPVYTFTITDPTNVAAFVLFAVLAIVVSNLAGRAQTQTVTALERVRSIESLYAFSRKLAGAGTLDDVLWATAYQIAAMLKVRVVLLLPENGSIGLKAGYPPEDTLEEADLAAAKWAWERNRPAGRDSDALPGAKWLFVPMRTGRGAIGILGIRRDEPGPLLRAEHRRLLDALERPGRAGDRARASRRGHRSRQARCGGRPAALGAADVDLARSEDAAVGSPRRRRGVARSVARRCRPGRARRHHHRRVGAPQPLHRQPARHDQARVGRRRAQPGAL